MGPKGREEDMDTSSRTTSVPVLETDARAKPKSGRVKRKDDDILTKPLLGSESSSSEEELGIPDPKVQDLGTAFKEPEEASWQIALQVFFPYLIAGLGMVGAGMVLDVVQVSGDFYCTSLFKFSGTILLLKKQA